MESENAETAAQAASGTTTDKAPRNQGYAFMEEKAGKHLVHIVYEVDPVNLHLSGSGNRTFGSIACEVHGLEVGGKAVKINSACWQKTGSPGSLLPDEALKRASVKSFD